MKPYYQDNHVTLYLGDCMDLLATLPDKAFDLAIVDPPYGIGEDGKSNHSRGLLAQPTKFEPKQWDAAIPPIEYFNELSRTSRNKIVWGGNYFPMPPTSCWVVWDKLNEGTDFADCELAWCSFKTAVRKFPFRWNGMLQGNMAEKERRIHPTQKPVALYKWLLANYAKPGQTILDTHLGSGSIAIACHYAGHHLTAIEKDEEYLEAAVLRYQRETAQQDMFAPNPSNEPQLEQTIML